MADSGPQYMSERFKEKCHNANIEIKISSPYYHQANGVVEKTVGIIKILWKKGYKERKSLYTAFWMYRTTPINNKLLSLYELLVCRKSKTILLTSKSALQSHHLEKEAHLDKNESNQYKQRKKFNKQFNQEKEALNNMEPIFVSVTLRNICVPGTIFNRPQPTREPWTYLINVRGKVYKRREHLKPILTTNQPSILETTSKHEASSLLHINTHSRERDHNTTNHKQNACSLVGKPVDNPTTPEKRAKTPTTQKGNMLQNQTTRSGGVTKIPERQEK